MRACQSCSALLVDGVLRCRECGADARAAQPAPIAAAYTVDAILKPDRLRMIDIADRLQALAPALMVWRRQSKATRGPRPDIRPTVRAEADALEAELDALARAVWPRKEG